jgi:hypothetical protein
MDFDDLGFVAKFQVKLFGQRSDRTPDYCFEVIRKPSASGNLTLETHRGRAYAQMIEVLPAEGNAWIGRFERGPEGISGLFGTPCPDTLVVVIEGQGYWIPTRQPASYEIVPAVPIKKVLRVPEREILLFVDFARISAYGPTGLLWRTRNVSWDGVRITDVSSESIRGFGWDSPGDRDVEFVVDVTTGETSGGSSPHQFSESS